MLSPNNVQVSFCASSSINCLGKTTHKLLWQGNADALLVLVAPAATDEGLLQSSSAALILPCRPVAAALRAHLVNARNKLHSYSLTVVQSVHISLTAGSDTRRA
uniref:Uncharacterized protein n=1 Tax=Lygus hesperus TaxID=30085 RepID=A0A146LYT9_LYGHE